MDRIENRETNIKEICWGGLVKEKKAMELQNRDRKSIGLRKILEELSLDGIHEVFKKRSEKSKD